MMDVGRSQAAQQVFQRRQHLPGLASITGRLARLGTAPAVLQRRLVLPELRRTKPDAVLVMDNRGAHKAPRVRALLDRSGFAYRFLPSYSPDLNPIEPAWAEVKSGLRRVGTPTAEALHRALGPALDGTTARGASGFFRRAGYGCPE